MSFCRICRTEQQQNLKYAPEQLIKIREKNSRAQNEIMEENACLLGNICYECEERLLSFSKLSDALDLDADSGLGETPVIVDDDDDLLYNFFFEKMKLHQQMQQHQQPQLLHLQENRSNRETDVASPRKKRNIQEQQQEQYKVVDFIDLADETSCSGMSEISTKPCKVEPKSVSNSKKRKRQKYFDESKIKLLAKLNLVSSDSEADEACTPENWHSISQLKNETITTKIPKVEECESYDIAIKSAPIKEECEYINCPACHMTYTCNQSLVHHMRSRHRDNEQETALRECERIEDDSALTIRLCYQSRDYYYECQLCGCLDFEIKAHQQHVIEKHSAELRSLKDPLLQKLQCPVCHKECGSLYIELCRHLLEQHRRPQYKMYLTEVNGSSKVPALIQKQRRELERSARIFLFNKGPYWYFQCRNCGKLSSNYKTHKKHAIEMHSFKVQVENPKIIKTQLCQRSTRQQSSKTAIRKRYDSKSIERAKKNREATKPIKAIFEKSAKTKDMVDEVKPTKTVVTKASKVVFAKPLKTIVTKAKKMKRGPKFLDKKISVCKLPEVLQVPTQIYRCDYCCMSFKGFFKLNLHILMTHTDKEFYNCHKCSKNFHSEMSLNSHEKSHDIEKFNGGIKKQRKHIAGACLTLDENSNAAKADCCKLFSNNVDLKKHKSQQENAI